MIRVREEEDIKMQKQLNSQIKMLQRYQGGKFLNCSDCSLSDSNLKQFTEICHQFAHIESINLSTNSITNYGIQELVKNIHHLVNLHTLIFDHNCIKSGLKVFCQLSPSLPNFTSISFDRNLIDDSDLIALIENIQKYPKLKTLSLRNTFITDKGIILLAHSGIKPLQNFQLGQNQITDEGFKAMIQNSQRFPNLKTLILLANQILGIKYRGIQAKFEALIQLNLNNMMLRDIGLKELASTGLFKNLQKINLKRTAISDFGVKILVDNSHYPALNFLNFRTNRLTEMSLLTLIKNIANMPMIQYVEMSDNRLIESQMKKWRNFNSKKMNLFVNF